MEYRTLGRTGITVSEIGFGAWAIGGNWGPVDDATSLAAMERALEVGINFIDTADGYGGGRSETLVGQVISGRRDKVVVCTKGGLVGHHKDPDLPPVYDKPEKVIAACEGSLQRLGTDYIDVYLSHIWWDNSAETAAFQRAFEQLKRAGKVRAVGVSTNDPAHLQHFNEDGLIDSIEPDYSIFSYGSEADLLPYCQSRQIGVIVRGPLAKGVLTGKFTPQSRFPEDDVRHDWPDEPWFRDQLAKVEQLRPLAGGNRTLGQLALGYVLSNPAVSVAIPGAKTPRQVEENAAASTRPLLSPEELAQIKSIAQTQPT